MVWLGGGRSVRQMQAQHSDAAARVREGMDDMFTIAEPGITRELARCLVQTTVIDPSTPWCVGSVVDELQERRHDAAFEGSWLYGSREIVQETARLRPTEVTDKRSPATRPAS